jgi:hypothetical protein
MNSVAWNKAVLYISKEKYLIRIVRAGRTF